MRQLADDELWAQACIQQALPRFPVEQYDDGSRPGMYDLKIVYSDDSIGAVEVTAAADAQQVELWKLVGGRGKRWLEPSLAGGWQVRILPSARAHELHRQLPSFLQDSEHYYVRMIRGDRSSTDRLTALAGDLRIVHAQQGPTAHPGSIYIMIEQPPEQMGGYSPLTGDPLAIWLGSWLAERSQADNIRKLAASDAREKHVFVLVAGFTPAPFAVIDLLIEPGAPLPTIPPSLPSGVTHVWAMSGWSTGDGFRWAPDVGWTRFTKVEPPAVS